MPSEGEHKEEQAFQTVIQMMDVTNKANLKARGGKRPTQRARVKMNMCRLDTSRRRTDHHLQQSETAMRRQQAQALARVACYHSCGSRCHRPFVQRLHLPQISGRRDDCVKPQSKASSNPPAHTGTPATQDMQETISKMQGASLRASLARTRDRRSTCAFPGG